MERDNSLIELKKRTTKIFEDIKDICENYLGDSNLTDTDPDMFIIMIKDKISEYDKNMK
jgi:hypothetical protein